METPTRWNQAIFWLPAVVKGSLKVALASLTIIVSQMDPMTSESVKEMGRIEWIRFWLPITIVALTTVSSFLDTTMQELKKDHETQFFKKSDSK